MAAAKRARLEEEPPAGAFQQDGRGGGGGGEAEDSGGGVPVWARAAACGGAAAAMASHGAAEASSGDGRDVPRAFVVKVAWGTQDAAAKEVQHVLADDLVPLPAGGLIAVAEARDGGGDKGTAVTAAAGGAGGITKRSDDAAGAVARGMEPPPAPSAPSSGSAGAGGDARNASEPPRAEPEAISWHINAAGVELVQCSDPALGRSAFVAFAVRPGVPLLRILGLRFAESVFAWVTSMSDLPATKDGPEALAKHVAARTAHFAPALREWGAAFPGAHHHAPPFRCSTFRSGKHAFNQMSLMPALAAALHEAPLGCPVSLTKHHLELCALIVGSRVDVGILVSPPDGLLARRSRNPVGKYTTALRSNLARFLLSLADIQSGDVVLDAMCGVGVVTAEAVAAHGGHVLSIGGDVEGNLRDAATFAATRGAPWRDAVTARYSELLGDAGADTRSGEGTTAPGPVPAERATAVAEADYLAWDARRLPLRSGSVDVIVVDLPFGSRHGTYRTIQRLYPAFAREAARILRPGGRAVLLTPCLKLVRNSVIPVLRPQVQCVREAPVDNGGKACVAFVFQKAK